jgi:hypothetical protein
MSRTLAWNAIELTTIRQRVLILALLSFLAMC